MELKLGIEVIESYKRLSYKAWYALAEYVDNSTQSYINNKALLDQVFEKESKNLEVLISYDNSSDIGFMQIEDNSIGMDKQDLERALTVGKRPNDTTGRSKYGLGLKTASFWFGDRWEIKTKKYGHAYEYRVIADLQELINQSYGSKTEIEESIETAKEQTTIEEIVEITPEQTKHGIAEIVDITIEKKKTDTEDNGINKVEFITSEPLDIELHYTIVKITKLNRKIAPATSRKIKDFLRSIYRVDLQDKSLSLIFQGVHLTWDRKYFTDRLLKDPEGLPYYTQLNFDILGKQVHGWAGVLESGSRKDGGFSILQAKRVIQGWPDAYRPTKLFGDQDGGINDLANQRLTGELYLDGFDVSHTKDEILFSEDEEDQLNDALFAALADYKRAANEYRKPVISENGEDDVDYNSIVNRLFEEIHQPKIANSVTDGFVLPSEVIKESNEEVFERTIQLQVNEIYTTVLSGINIKVIINADGSPYDPYLLIRSRAERDAITIIINKNHVHWKTLKTTDMILYFIKHCILDGLAEWKAYFIAGDLDPDTIKNIKDSYLRLNLEVL